MWFLNIEANVKIRENKQHKNFTCTNKQSITNTASLNLPAATNTCSVYLMEISHRNNRNFNNRGKKWEVMPFAVDMLIQVWYLQNCLLFFKVYRRDSSLKNENFVINYSPSCRLKPVRPSFIFRTQIKIFLMKSERFLTLHRQQHNWKV